MDFFQIIPATKEHLSQIIAIEESWDPVPWSEQIFKYEIANPQNTFLVAILAQTVVGYGDMGLAKEDAHLYTLAISTTYQRKGLGKRLLIALLQRAQACEAKRVFLEVRKSNLKAQNLYLQQGFQITGLRKSYYIDNKEDATLMTLENLQCWMPIS